VAGEAWLRLALAEGRLADAALFLRGGGMASATALAGTLSMAAQLREPPLAEAAAAALRAAPALPEGWTNEEVAVTAALSRPPGATTLAAALNLLDWASEAAARDRVVLLLASAPEAGAAASQLAEAQLAEAQHPRHPAAAARGRRARGGGDRAPRPARGAGAGGGGAAAGCAGGSRAGPLRRRPGAGQAAGRGRGGRDRSAAEPAAEAGPPAAGTGGVPGARRGAAGLQPALRVVAEEVLGSGWRRRYEAALTRQGRRPELIAALRARAALAEPAEREEIAVRLDQLGDAAGAAAIRRGEDEEA
jgi:hypothetical protein